MSGLGIAELDESVPAALAVSGISSISSTTGVSNISSGTGVGSTGSSTGFVSDQHQILDPTTATKLPVQISLSNLITQPPDKDRIKRVHPVITPRLDILLNLASKLLLVHSSLLLLDDPRITGLTGTLGNDGTRDAFGAHLGYERGDAGVGKEFGLAAGFGEVFERRVGLEGSLEVGGKEGHGRALVGRGHLAAGGGLSTRWAGHSLRKKVYNPNREELEVSG